MVAERVRVALLTATYIALEVQMRGEEAYLEAMHGEACRNYSALVRRWFGQHIGVILQDLPRQAQN